ncbi:MAG: flagellar hook-associated protein FlgL [Acidobacteria bacterium]|nr:flagellar hook-associated protein FlgL [Acidobacteriota bacterium]
MSYRNLLAGTEALRESMEKASLQVSSGKKILSLADSPSGSAELVDIRSQLAELDQYRANASSGSFLVGLAEAILSSAHNVVTSIYTRGSAGATSYWDADELATLAAEVRVLRDELLSLANSAANGRYLFAGSRVTEAPFTLDGDQVSYRGDTVENKISVADGLEVKQNVPGSAAFSSAFAAIEALLTALDSGDLAGMNAALSQFSGALRDVSWARADLGVSLAAIQSAESEQNIRETVLRSRRGAIQDADLVEAVSRLKSNEAALEATFTARAVVGQKNLFDFLA